MTDKKSHEQHITIDLSRQADEELKAADRAVITRYKEKQESGRTAPKLKVEKTSNGTASISFDGDAALTALALLESFGTTSFDFSDYALQELLDAACRGGSDKPYPKSQINGVVAAMHGINPQDEIEGMLASQMVATHFMAMRRLRSVKNSETITQQDSHGNLAIKLMRTFTAQMEALNRYRGKGQQKMTVEHVHVHAGGQAIVGNVNQPEGGGVQKKTEEQPHAKAITHAPEQAMPSKSKKRSKVPVPRNA